MEGKTSIFKKVDFWIYILLVGLSLAVAIYTQLPALSSRYVINDDVRQHTYWMGRFHDKGLFLDDIYVQYNNYLSPYGFKFLYYLLTFVLDPILAGKLLSIILYAVSGVFLFKIGKLLQDRLVGIILFSLFILFPAHIERFAGGLHRAFAYPLLIIFLYYLFRFELKKCLVVLILQILFYPVIFLVCYPLLLLTLLLSLTKTKEMLSSRAILGLALIPLAAAALFLLIKFITRPDFLGALISKKEILSNPSFYAGGRTHLLPLENTGLAVKRLLLGHKLFIFFAPLFLLCFLSDIFKKKNLRKYKIILGLFICSLFVYYLARIFLCKFFIPQRYIGYSLPLVSILIIAIGAGLFFRIEKPFFFTIFIILAFFAYAHTIKPGIGCTVDQKTNAPLFEYLASLPKDSLIAANPYLSDDITCFSRRKTLLKWELSEASFGGYAAIINKRTLDFFRAYYSNSGRKIYDFCKTEGIKFLVIDLGGSSERHPANKKMSFLQRIDRNKALFSTKDYFVIAADEDTLLE